MRNETTAHAAANGCSLAAAGGEALIDSVESGPGGTVVVAAVVVIGMV